MRVLLAAVVTVVSTACAAATFHTVKLSAEEAGQDKPVEGVVYYDPEYVKLTFSFATRIDKDGNVVGRSDEHTCVEVIQKEEIQILPDLKSPRAIISTPSRWASGKLAVTLSNGMLVSVNAESNPQAGDLLKGVGAVLTAAAPIFAIKGEAPPEKGKVPACNAGPRLTRFERYTP